MQCELLRLEGAPAELAAELRGLIDAPEMVQSAVAEIVAEVRAHGNEALHDYTRRFDTGGSEPPPLIVEPGELERARDELDRHGQARPRAGDRERAAGWGRRRSPRTGRWTSRDTR